MEGFSVFSEKPGPQRLLSKSGNRRPESANCHMDEVQRLHTKSRLYPRDIPKSLPDIWVEWGVRGNMWRRMMFCSTGSRVKSCLAFSRARRDGEIREADGWDPDRANHIGSSRGVKRPAAAAAAGTGGAAAPWPGNRNNRPQRCCAEGTGDAMLDIVRFLPQSGSHGHLADESQKIFLVQSSPPCCRTPALKL